MYSFLKESATIKRMNTSSGKSIYVDTGLSYKGYLKPISTQDTLYQDKFGQDYYFTTIDTADIQTSDLLTINGEEYKVKGLGKWSGISIKYKKFIIVKVKGSQ